MRKLAWRWVIPVVAGWLGCAGAGAQSPWPQLPGLIEAVRTNAMDAVAASQLASALMHRDWMVPAEAPAEVRWLPAGRNRRAEGGLVSPDGRRRLEWTESTLRVVSLPEGTPVANVEGVRAWETVQWHPGGFALALAGAQGVEIRDGRTLRTVVTNVPGAVGPALGFSAEGLWLAAGRAEGGVGLWDWAGGRLLSVGLPGWGRIDGVEFDATGRHVRIQSGQRLQVLDVRVGQALSDWHGSTTAVQTAVFTPDRRRVLSSSVDGVIQLRDVAGVEPTRLVRLALGAGAIAMTPDGAWMATRLGDKLRLWDLGTGRPVGSWLMHPGHRGLHLSADGRVAWSASTNSLRYWWPRTSRLEPTIVVSDAMIHATVSDPGAKALAALMTGTNGLSVGVWRPGEPEKPAVVLPVWGDGVLDVDPTGEWLLTVSTNGGVRQRRWAAGGSDPGRSDIGSGIGMRSARYSQDGRWVVTLGLDSTLQVWGAADGVAHGKALRLSGLEVGGVEVFPGGRRARIEAGGRLAVWDLLEGRELTVPWVGGGRPLGGLGDRGSRVGADGASILVPGGDGSWRLAALPPEGHAPGWLVGMGELVWGTSAQAPAILLATVRREVWEGEPVMPWVKWGRWWMSDRGTRPVSPGTGMDARGLAARHLELGTVSPLLEAYRLDPVGAALRVRLRQQMQTNQFWVRPFRAEQGGQVGGE